MTDAEIKGWIQQQLRRAPATTPSALLRRFRDDGRACEQSRFKRLAEQVRYDLN
jgi:hypothetical protein